MARILVVDDEPYLREAIQLVLRSRQHDVDAVGAGEEAIARYQARPYDALVLDVSLPGMSGVDVLRRLRSLSSDAVAVFITAHGSIQNAVEAIKAGGYDYLTKPFDNDELVMTVERALDHRRLTARVAELEEDLTARTRFPGIVGQSAAIQAAVRRLAKVAASDATVLISGESGTGKELAARTLHRSSGRSGGPFVAINCGAIPSTLAESELFGHERGAFTDAKGERRGRFEQAHQGTLFLDEIGELPLDIQVKLLRVLQEQEVTRVGGVRSIPVNVRVVAATNRDLQKEFEQGRFREDLFWRLNVFQVEMPALRQRLGDLPLLVEHLLERINAECRTKIVGVSLEASERLSSHRWPGNVRELANALKHAAIMSEGAVIELRDLPEYMRTSGPQSESGSPETLVDERSLPTVMAETEKRLIEAALRRFEGNRSAAAAALGISRRTLYTKMDLHRLQAADDEEPS